MRWSRATLAIVPAARSRSSRPDLPRHDALVDALVRGRAAAILIVEGETVESRLQALAEAALAAELPALRIARADPPCSSEARSASSSTAGPSSIARRRSSRPGSRRSPSGGSPGELASSSAVIGSFLGRAVALEGRRGETIVVHAPADLPDGAAAVARYHAGSLGARRVRVALPGTADGGPLAGSSAAGSLALLGERPATELERVVVERVAGLLALELTRTEAVRRARDAGPGRGAPADGPPWVVLVARQMVAGDGLTAGQREEIRRELRLLAPARRMALRGSAESLELRAVAVADGRTSRRLELAGRVAGAARAHGRGVPAVRRAGRSAGGRRRSAGDPRGGGVLADAPMVARADRMAAYRLLAQPAQPAGWARHARALLEPLLAGRPDVRREHLATLKAVLERPGLAEAAAELGIHRNTVAYRVRRIEAVTGWRLADPDLRLPLALALRLVQTDQDSDR